MDAGSRPPIAAIVVGAVGGFFVAIILGGVLLCVRRRRRKNRLSDGAGDGRGSVARGGDRVSEPNYHAVEPFPPPLPSVGKSTLLDFSS